MPRSTAGIAPQTVARDGAKFFLDEGGIGVVSGIDDLGDAFELDDRTERPGLLGRHHLGISATLKPS